MEDIKTISELFNLNFDILNEEFPAHSNSRDAKICAAYFTSKRMKIDAEELGNACFLIKDRCGHYSALCDRGLLASASLLCTEKRDIESRIDELAEICRDLGAHREGQNITASAVFLAEAYANPIDWTSISSAIRTLKHEAISRYPSLGELDRTLCTAFVLSGDDPTELLSDTERCLGGLNAVYGTKENNTYAAGMLAMCGGSTELKLSALKDFTDRIHQAGAKVTPFSLPPIISLLCSRTDADIHSRIGAFCANLRHIKGFGIFSMPQSKRLSLSALAAATHTDKKAELLALDKMFKEL